MACRYRCLAPSQSDPRHSNDGLRRALYCIADRKIQDETQADNSTCLYFHDLLFYVLKQ